MSDKMGDEKTATSVASGLGTASRPRFEPRARSGMHAGRVQTRY